MNQLQHNCMAIAKRTVITGQSVNQNGFIYSK